MRRTQDGSLCRMSLRKDLLLEGSLALKRSIITDNRVILDFSIILLQRYAKDASCLG